jgi:hypothetical protein
VDSKKTVLVVQKDSSASASAVSNTFEQRCCGSVKVAVAYEFDSLGGSVGRTQARPIRVMESYQSPHLNISRRSPYIMLNAALPTDCLIEALESNQIKRNQIESSLLTSSSSFFTDLQDFQWQRAAYTSDREQYLHPARPRLPHRDGTQHVRIQFRLQQII